MAVSDEDLEKRIQEATKKLLRLTHHSDQNLLHLLDELFICLEKVEQSPPDSTEKALSPVIKALVDEGLFKHSNVDVKVSVASCIIEITRITAPDAPYDDDTLREVFQLIVSSFEHLADSSSRSYAKRICILETLAKIKVGVVMLDLGCDSLLIEMFQHFLMSLRDHHPMKVFLYMENIMTLVLEESEDIPPQLLSPILQYVKKDDKIPKVSRRLAEQVLCNCAEKLKTYLSEAVKSSGVSLDEYSNVVASICEGTFNGLKQDEVVGHHQQKEKAAEVSIPEQTCVTMRRLDMENHDSSVNVISSKLLIRENSDGLARIDMMV